MQVVLCQYVSLDRFRSHQCSTKYLARAPSSFDWDLSRLLSVDGPYKDRFHFYRDETTARLILQFTGNICFGLTLGGHVSVR